jgi:class 3 adenylate cyclase
LTNRNIIKVHRETLDAAGRPELKWQMREWVNSTRQVRWDNTFPDKGDYGTYVRGRVTSVAYDPYTQGWFKLGVNLTDDEFSWAGPFFQTYVEAKNATVAEMTFRASMPASTLPSSTTNLAPMPWYTVFKLKVLISTLSGVLEEAQVGARGHIFIINTDLEVIAKPSKESWASLEGFLPAESSRLRLVRAIKSAGTDYFTDAGNAYLVSPLKSAVPNWRLVVGINMVDAVPPSISSLSKLTRAIGAGTLALLCIYILFVFAKSAVSARDSKTMFEAVYHGTNEIIIVCTTLGGIVSVNRAAGSALGGEAVVGTNVRDYFVESAGLSPGPDGSARSRGSAPAPAVSFSEMFASTVSKRKKVNRASVRPYAAGAIYSPKASARSSTTGAPQAQGDAFDAEMRLANGETLPVEVSLSLIPQGASMYVTLVAHSTADRLAAAHAQRTMLRATRDLLYAAIPKSVALRLMSNPNEVIADSHQHVGAAFIDIVGFTPMCSSLKPIQVVEVLSLFFSTIDDAVSRYPSTVEKVKTIGDCVFLVSGCFGSEDPEHTHLVHLVTALSAAISKIKALSATGGFPGGAVINVRAGVHFGPVASGVVGTTKKMWDVWGDAINIAARLESAAPVNSVLCSEEVKAVLESKRGVVIKKAGEKLLKGKGNTETFTVEVN